MRRDYRNYDVGQRIQGHHQHEIFKTEHKGFDAFNDPTMQLSQLMDRIDPTWIV